MEPHGSAHSLIVARFEKHAAQSRVIVFASHHLAAERSPNSIASSRPNWSRLSIRRSKEPALPRIRAARDPGFPGARLS
jgi:hypothetical protein